MMYSLTPHPTLSQGECYKNGHNFKETDTTHGTSLLTSGTRMNRLFPYQCYVPISRAYDVRIWLSIHRCQFYTICMRTAAWLQRILSSKVRMPLFFQLTWIHSRIKQTNFGLSYTMLRTDSDCRELISSKKVIIFVKYTHHSMLYHIYVYNTKKWNWTKY